MSTRHLTLVTLADSGCPCRGVGDSALIAWYTIKKRGGTKVVVPVDRKEKENDEEREGAGKDLINY